MPAANRDSRYLKALNEFRAYLITEELIQHHGSLVKASKSLGIHYNSLQRLVGDLGLNLKNIKQQAEQRLIEKTEKLDKKIQETKRAGLKFQTLL